MTTVSRRYYDPLKDRVQELPARLVPKTSSDGPIFRHFWGAICLYTEDENPYEKLDQAWARCFKAGSPEPIALGGNGLLSKLAKDLRVDMTLRELQIEQLNKMRQEASSQQSAESKYLDPVVIPYDAMEYMVAYAPAISYEKPELARSTKFLE
ncbi:hypothetical protein FRB98_000408 [Tulasnella sp. 332]|nr:hypothetical protein FRB98_000408 [Tulasnella sp. 332]